MHAVLLGLPGLQILVCINMYEDVSLLREESAARNTCSGNLRVLPTELFEEMPHEAAPDSSSVLVGILCSFVKQEIFQKHMKMVPETSVHT